MSHGNQAYEEHVHVFFDGSRVRKIRCRYRIRRYSDEVVITEKLQCDEELDVRQEDIDAVLSALGYLSIGHACREDRRW